MTDDLIDSITVPESVPILPLKGTVMLPFTVQAIAVGRPRSMRLLDEVLGGDKLLGLVAAESEEIEDPGPGQLYRVATLGQVARMIRSESGAQLIVQGIDRISIDSWIGEEPYLSAKISHFPDVMPPESNTEAEALVRNLTNLFARFLKFVPNLSQEELLAAMIGSNPRQLFYTIANVVPMAVEEAQQLLELDPFMEKLRHLTKKLTHELEVLELGKKIRTEAESEIGKTQREYILREQLKAIRRELGEDEEGSRVEEFREKIDRSVLPEEAFREARRELGRLEKLQPASPEYGVIETYLDWLTAMPWNKKTDDQLDMQHARRVLDEDHYGLEKIKERILEFLAVRKLRVERLGDQAPGPAGGPPEEESKRSGAILCFLGPPGVGKTSLGQSIARALGRKFVRMSLGGMRDEAEIRGHRRTYIGAMPGRVVQAIRRAGYRNPVFMLDEVDKIGKGWQGDPASALLEVLDPAQNHEFRDHYLDVPFDLSDVMFITTANLPDPIPGPLQDRMEILELSGYTEQEKLPIAQRYLVPRQIQESGLTEQDIRFEPEALVRLIRDYTREAGVRELERQIANVCRKVAAKIAEGGPTLFVVDEKQVEALLGKPRYFFEPAERTEVPGVATGLAMTAAGGDILFIEATRMPGEKGLILTGHLGDVMKESAQAALSYVRSQAENLGFDPNFFDRSDIHVHVPAGAIPKDGPSAGITIATALASLLSSRPVRADVGMTGEITLRGQVLPVGGVKEKILAAHRAGLRTVILPTRNEKDLEDVPPNIREEMEFVLAERIDRVFERALSPETAPVSARAVNQ